MKTRLFLLVAIVLLLFTAGWVGYAQKETTRWEYNVIRTLGPGADIQGQLNSLGGNGWQLVSVTEVQISNSYQTSVTLYLKRPK